MGDAIQKPFPRMAISSLEKGRHFWRYTAIELYGTLWLLNRSRLRKGCLPWNVKVL